MQSYVRRSGNLAFSLDLFSWVCQKTGQLRLADLSYRAVGQAHVAPSYRIGTALVRPLYAI